MVLSMSENPSETFNARPLIRSDDAIVFMKERLQKCYATIKMVFTKYM
jgi:hypothetical protein